MNVSSLQSHGEPPFLEYFQALRAENTELKSRNKYLVDRLNEANLIIELRDKQILAIRQQLPNFSPCFMGLPNFGGLEGSSSAQAQTANTDTLPSNLPLNTCPQIDSQISQSSLSATEERFYSDGFYSGQIQHGVRSGKGEMIYNDGTVYNGEWADDQPRGHGTLTYSQGVTFIGRFFLGFKWGRGTIQYPEGSSLTGEWIRDEITTGTFLCGNISLQGNYQKKFPFDPPTLHGDVVCTFQQKPCPPEGYIVEMVQFLGKWNHDVPPDAGNYKWHLRDRRTGNLHVITKYGARNLNSGTPPIPQDELAKLPPY